MKTKSLIALAALCLPAATQAQAPQMEKTVSMAMAQTIIASAIEGCVPRPRTASAWSS